MSIYIVFLVSIVVLAGAAPRLMRRPWVLLLMCLALALSLYSPQVFN